MAAIAQIVESFAYGTAKSVLQLCKMIDDGHHTTIFYGRRPGTEIDLPEECDSVRWVELPGQGPAKHVSNVNFLRQKLGEADYGLVHGHSAYGGMYAKLVAPRQEIPTLYSPRGYSFLREDFPKPVRWLFRQIEAATARRCVTVCCGPYEHRLSQQLGGDSVRINNGFQIESPGRVEALQPVILGVGRICRQKGFDTFQEIASQCPQHEFLWIGEGSPSEGAVSSTLPPNLKQRPYLPHDELLEQIRRARVILLPSRWEGLSRFLIESVCMSKAIITSRFPGNLDCLDGEASEVRMNNGFACHTLGDYCDAVNELMGDDAVLCEMQDASYRHAVAEFDIDSIHERWKDLYRKLMSQRP